MKFTQSISGRLNALFVVIVSLVLMILGAYNYVSSKNRLEAGLAEQADALAARLQLSLPSAIWNFDKAQIGQVLGAEMVGKTFNGIRLQNGKDYLTGLMRNADGKVQQASPEAKIEGVRREIKLQFEEAGQKKDVAVASIYIAHDSVDDALRESLIALVIQIILVDIVLLVALSFSLEGVVLRPLRHLNQALKDIASGEADLTRRIKVVGQDEFADVSRSFNIFIERLQGVMSRVADTAPQLAAAAEQTSRITESSSAGIQLQQQQSRMVVSAVDELSRQVHEISLSTGAASEAAKQADQEAERGLQVVHEAIASIREAASEVENAAQVISELARNSERIGNVLGVINDIAKQTNLLALNAAIEAARAGESGRGFAVVADEVRVLANRTHDSTTEIQTAIAQLREGTLMAVSVMQSSRAKAGTGLRQAQEADTTIQHLAESARKIAQINVQIASASDQQDRAVSNVSGSIAQIQQVVSEAADGAQQTTISAEEVARLAVQLQAAVEQFKV